jgi:hypothetical protein
MDYNKFNDAWDENNYHDIDDYILYQDDDNENYDEYYYKYK